MPELKRSGPIWMNKGKQNRQLSLQKRRRLVGGVLFLPILAGTVLFFALPFCMVVGYSFGLGGGQARFVGA